VTTVVHPEPPDPHTPSAELSLLPGVNVLLEGPAGTGKTTALGTIADAGVELFCLFTENGRETLMGYWTDRGLPVPPNVHWHDLPRGEAGFSTLAESANTVNTYAMEALFKMNDPNRHKSNQFVTLLRALADFPDDRTGQKFGSVDKWGPNRCLAIDSLTGINPIAMSLVIGNKPLKDQRDWGIAQDQIEKLLRQCCDGAKCHFVLTAHVEREVDQVFGGVKVTVSTLGRALAPKVPPMFSDVILSVREGIKFSWSTANPQADLKARNVPIADGIPPDFKQIFNKWCSRGGRFTDKVKVGPSPPY
jgi:hypothetical protein